MARPSTNPADQIKELIERIADERAKLEECLANIADYANRLRQVAVDSGQRLLTKD